MINDPRSIGRSVGKSQSKLVRYPLIYPTESLAGYILRLAEVNGLSSPGALLSFAGMNRDELSLTTLNLDKLAAITGHSLASFEELAFKSSEDAQAVRLLGSRVSSQDLSFVSARVCPTCVTELGFIEAHWHLDLMVACPVHKQAALWFCGNCKKKIRWKRHGMLECSCGAPLLRLPRDEYTAQDYWLLDLLRRKALDIPQSPRSDSNVFERLVTKAPLHSLLSAIRLVGRKRLLASWNREPLYARQILPAGARVLADWPTNFEALLKALAPESARSSPLALGENFEGIFAAVEEATSRRFALTNQQHQVSEANSAAALDRVQAKLRERGR